MRAHPAEKRLTVFSSYIPPFLYSLYTGTGTVTKGQKTIKDRKHQRIIGQATVPSERHQRIIGWCPDHYHQTTTGGDIQHLGIVSSYETKKGSFPCFHAFVAASSLHLRSEAHKIRKKPLIT
jgi:hypothetical protein